MPIRPREDVPGALHHVGTRGVARRTIADTRREMRFFQSLLAKNVRHGRIEVLAFCLMANHVHLLVRSVDGELSEAMQWMLSVYARRFNRRRDRDGPLVSRRFWSRRITDDIDRLVVARYIDLNPVRAGLVQNAADYPFGSARCYSVPKGPPWLSRQALEDEACLLSGVTRFRPSLYSAYVTRALDENALWVVERRLEHGPGPGASIEALAHDGLGGLRTWMIEALRNADGVAEPRVFMSPDYAMRAVDVEADCETWNVARGRHEISAWLVMKAGLLRGACGLAFREIALRLDVPDKRVRRLLDRHRTLLLSNARYGELVAGILQRGLRALVGGCVTVP